MTKTKNVSLGLEGLSTGYKSRQGQRVVSSSLNLSINQGEFVALLGTNGCGKSTLLRTIAGLQDALSGRIFINGTDIRRLGSKAKARLLSLVLTDRVLTPYLIVEDIVGIGRYPHIGYMGLLSKEDKAIVERCLEQCGLLPLRHRAYIELSDGEKQRVMLARAVAQDTPLMMLDEATAHLDLPNRIALMKLLRELARQMNKAILLSTHELELALQCCDKLWLMGQDGSIIEGASEDLILNDSFTEVFKSELFDFDSWTGSFKLRRELRAKIFITGKELHRLWTARAVEREGFALTEDLSSADLIISISEEGWSLHYGDESKHFPSIGSLISELRNYKFN